MAFLGLNRFYSDAKKGKLPQVSFIVGPMELSEHSPHLPKDGAWLQQQVADAVTSSPKYGKTVLMISYDGKSLLLGVFQARNPKIYELRSLSGKNLADGATMSRHTILQRGLPGNG